jgi:hypothetical protein
MQFHDYITMKPPGCRGTSEHYIRSMMLSHACSNPARSIRGCLELCWIGQERPYYNVYPIAVELCQKTSLNMKWGDILFPTTSLALRFAVGHEPLGLSSAILRVPSEIKREQLVEFHPTRAGALACVIAAPIAGVVQRKSLSSNAPDWIWTYPASKDIKEELLSDSVPEGFTQCSNDEIDERAELDQARFLIKLLAFIGLLSRGNDLITPTILSKDRQEYDATSDESRRRWLEERAAKRLGRGFDVGRSMEIERASSPHWRCPHLALFHTGPGRTTPVLKVRSGCVVIPKDMSSVPTGYLGQERPDEQPHDRPIKYRTPIPKRVRFRVLRRDGYRCRLCGLTAEDGVQLEVDHRVPVAKGGGNSESNLWTLCQPCNSGKSDSDLTLTAATAE